MRIFHPKKSALIWLLLMLAFGTLGSRILAQDWLETAFLALLPVAEQDLAVEEAIQHHNNQRDRNMVWLVGGSTSGSALDHARQVEQRLRESRLFQATVLEMSQQQFVAQYRQLFQYRYQLLDGKTKDLLSTDPSAFLSQNRTALYSPMGQAAAAGLERDPLMLFNRYLDNLNTTVRVSLERGVVVLHDRDHYWVMIISELQDSRLQLDKLEALLGLTKNIKTEIIALGGDIMVTGMPLFTAYGADSAKQEISTVGIGSSAGIIIIMLLTFRSPRPLLLSTIAISSGLFAALIVSILVFGKVHIITLVFGASLIGVADDYALHFVCDSFGEKNWLPPRALRYIFPGLLMGLLINLLSYAGLILSPFPGLQEVALFSAVGLLVAWLTVVMLFPLLLTRFQPDPRSYLFRIANYWQQHWPAWLNRHRKIIYPVLMILVIGGIGRLEPRDDVRLLQSAGAELLVAAEQIKRLAPVSQENQFFLVSGENIQDWHRNEQNLLRQLKIMQDENKFNIFLALSEYWPDESQQKANYDVLDKMLYRPGLVKKYMIELGFSADAINKESKQFNAAKNKVISLVDWLENADSAKRMLWLGCSAQHCRSIVDFSGIKDMAALASLQGLPGVIWVDQVETMSDLFARYRVRVGWLIIAAYSLVFVGLGIRFGWRNGLAILSIPVVSTLVALAMIGWTNQLFSLFNLFALLLVLGIGVDDAIFFFMAANLHQSNKEIAKEKRAGTALAVVLSAITTLLAFGLLALSSTEIVHAFGFTVACGIMTALLLSPLIGHNRAGQD